VASTIEIPTMRTANREIQSEEKASRQEMLAATSERDDMLATRVAPANTVQRIVGAPVRAVRPADVLILQRMVGNQAVQGLLDRRAGRFGLRDANGVAEAADSANSSIAEPLPEAVRGSFERTLDTELSGVRVHTGNQSAEAAEAVGAEAYTIGQDIHFGTAEYAPTNAAGLHLLAHEVAHTVQHRGAASMRLHGLDVSVPTDSAEIEADRAADAMVSDASFEIDGVVSGIHRQEAANPQTTPGTTPISQTPPTPATAQGQGTTPREAGAPGPAVFGKCTEFGDFDIYPDNFVGPLPRSDRASNPFSAIPRKTQPWVRATTISRSTVTKPAPNLSTRVLNLLTKS
jgi:hypothetical protein